MLISLKQIPVFLSQTLAKQLYIFQYPIKSATDNWKDAAVLDCKIKPIHQRVKLEIGLDTESNAFDISKAEEIALNTDGYQVFYLYVYFFNINMYAVFHNIC